MKAKKSQDVEQLLKQAEEYNSKKHLLGIEWEPLTNTEIAYKINNMKQTIDEDLKWLSQNYNEIKTEAKTHIRTLDRPYLEGKIPTTEIHLNKIRLLTAKGLYEKYKTLSRKEISTEKRRLTVWRKHQELFIYKKFMYRTEALEKIVPTCVEYLDMEYKKYYSILNQKTEIIKKNQSAVKMEIARLENIISKGEFK